MNMNRSFFNLVVESRLDNPFLVAGRPDYLSPWRIVMFQ